MCNPRLTNRKNMAARVRLSVAGAASRSALRSFSRSLSIQSAVPLVASAGRVNVRSSLAAAEPRKPVFFASAQRHMTGTANSVVLIKNLTDYNNAVEKAGSNLIVAYHTAAWCGPCKMIWPHVIELSEKHPNASFLKIDVDEAQDVAASNKISAMPTFLFFKGGALKEKLVGANPAQLKALVAQFA